MKTSVLIHPFHCPLSLVSDCLNVGDGIEEIVFLVGILDVGVYKQGISFRVNVFHGNLKAIKTSGFGYLNFAAKLLRQVLKHDSI